MAKRVAQLVSGSTVTVGQLLEIDELYGPAGFHSRGDFIRDAVNEYISYWKKEIANGKAAAPEA